MKRRQKYVIVLFFLFTWTWSGGPLASEDQTKRIKAGLSVIRTHWQKGLPLVKNPLEGVDILPYYSRGHLLYYRGLGHWLVGQGIKGEGRPQAYIRALGDLRRIQAYPFMERKRIDQTIRQITEASVRECLRRKMFYTAIHLIEDLPLEEQKKGLWVLSYGQALFESKQFTSFSRLVNQFPQLFQDKELIKTSLSTPPHWDKMIRSSLGELATPTTVTVTAPDIVPAPSAPAQQLDLSPQGILDNFPAILTFLQKGYYRQESKRVFKEVSRLYFSLQRKKELSPQETKFIKNLTASMDTLAPHMMVSLITSFWRAKELKTAASLSESFLKEFNGHPSVPLVLYDLGRIREDGREYGKAYKSYQAFLEISDDRKLEEYALFRSGWMLYLQGEKQKALPHLQKYLQSYPEGKYASTCEYLLIKLSGETNKNEGSGENGVPTGREKVRAFMQKYPLNLYSLILLDEWKLPKEDLLQLLSPVPSLKGLDLNRSLFRADIPTLKLLKVYGELREFGLKEDAWKLLMLAPHDEQNDLFMLHLAAEFERLEYTHGLTSRLNKVYSSFPHLRGRVPWQGLFPRFRLDLIQETLKQQKLTFSPYLVLALIRQESAFNPEARSSANAFGLMQLIQPTARGVANRLDLAQFDLFKEEDNVKIGIANLAALIKKYRGRLDYALSAYNAGETITDIWIELRGHLAPLEFVESIPYNETRFYIKNVLRNYFFYQLIYEKESGKKGKGDPQPGSTTQPLVQFTVPLDS